MSARESPSPGGSKGSSTVSWLWGRFLRRTPQQERSRALVDAVVDAYAERLDSGEKVTDEALSPLMRRAGVAAGSFYEYFSGEDSLTGALIARVTQKNFDDLLAAVDRAEPRSLEDIVRTMASEAAQTYLGRPRLMRAVLGGIERFGLHGHIVRERDRFVREIAHRARAFSPDSSSGELERKMRVVADACMGVIAAAALRSDAPDVAQVARDLELIGAALFRDPPR